MSVCEICHSEISISQEAVLCPSDRAPHHRECWNYYGGCGSLGCRHNPHSANFVRTRPSSTQVLVKATAIVERRNYPGWSWALVAILGFATAILLAINYEKTKDLNSARDTYSSAQSTIAAQEIAASDNQSTIYAQETTIVDLQSELDIQSTAIALFIPNPDSSLLLGPEKGSLYHEEDDYVETAFAMESIKNFMAMVRFSNPYDASTKLWDYGLFFRGIPGYRIYVRSDKHWVLELWNNQGYVQGVDGPVGNLNTSRGEENIILLVVKNGNAVLLVNSVYVTSIDVSDKQTAGEIYVGTGFVNGDEVNGKVTSYQDLTVWSIP